MNMSDDERVGKVKAALKRYPILKARYTYLQRFLEDKKDRLTLTTSPHVASLDNMGIPGTAQPPGMEQTIIQRERVQEEIAAAEKESLDLQSQIKQIDTAIDLLGSPGQILKDKFINRCTWEIVARKNSLSISGCHRQAMQLLQELAVIMYGLA